MINDYNTSLSEHINVFKSLKNLKKEVNSSIEKLSNSLNKNSKIFFCGNGGSAADAQHLAAELIVKFKKKRIPLPGISLALDTSTMTACSNDYDFSEVYLRSFQALAKKNDILIILSTSGNSKNILKLIKYANKKNFYIIGFLGNKGGLAKKFCNISLIVESNSTARIQECHIFLGHYIIEKLEQNIDFSLFK